MKPEEKAATIILLAGDENIQRLLLGIPKEMQKKAFRALAKVPALNEGDIKSIVDEFIYIVKNLEHEKSTNLSNQAASILKKAGEALKEESWTEQFSHSFLLNDVRDLLNEIETMVLYKWLLNEHPQTIACVLAIGNAKKMAKIFTQFPDDSKTLIIQKISQINSLEPPELTNLYEELANLKSRKGIHSLINPGGTQKVVELLQASSPEIRMSILEKIGEKAPELHQQIIKELVTVERLSGLLPNHLSLLCSCLPDQVISLGLRLEQQSVREIFLNALSKKR
ncbi:MAG: hypothetical protein K2X39_05790, partial [Silvanigrellaceae bacterium]|nr:hypothetical protein [Silvanigrellaceae bacterium]